MNGYAENLRVADESVRKLIEELDIESDNKILLMSRWITMKRIVENQIKWKERTNVKED